MVPYYVLVAAPVFSVILQYFFRKRYNIENEKKNIAIVVFFFIYFLLVALRHKTIGADTWNYTNWFIYAGGVSWNDFWQTFSKMDIGYFILNKIVSVFTNNVQILFIVVAFISIYPIAKLYYKESEIGLISISLFLILPIFMMNFSGLRQGMAMGIGVFAYYAAREKNLKKFLLLVLAAYLCHNSAFILLALYFICSIKIRRIHLLLLIPAFIFVNINRVNVFLRAVSWLENIIGDEFGGLSVTNTYMMLLLFSLFVIYAFFAPNEELIDEETSRLRNIMVIVTFIQIFASVNQIAMRINYYFLIFVPLLIPRITNRWVKVDSRLKLLVKTVIYGYFIYYYFTGTVVTDSLQIYPYMFFWES